MVAEEKGEYIITSTGEIHLNRDEIARMIKDLEGQMKAAARLLEFEKAAALRDKIVEFRRMMEVEV
jgi:excinuclease ABC subunit B